MDSTNIKVLLSAYACEPDQGSEEGVGWNMAIATARNQEVWVLTRTFCKESIEAELSRNPRPNLHFAYLEPLGWSQDWKNTQGAVQLHYYLWQIWAYFVARKLHKQQSFNVVHHVTYVKFWSPSFLSLLPIPFVWGPVGGGEAAPKAFWKDFSLRAKIYETARDFAQKIGERDPFTRITARRSRLAYATTKDTAERLEALSSPDIQIYSESGLSKQDIETLGEFQLPDDGVIRFISVGRLIHWKAFHLGLRAFLQANLKNAEYWIVGDGVEKAALQALAEQSDLSKNIKFFGRLPRAETLQKLAQSHVVVHPSLHDSGGWACLEAMAAGRPVICLDLGGPAVQVTSDCGIAVPAVGPEETIRALANAMKVLAGDYSLICQMGAAGSKRIRESFEWSIKADYFSRQYQTILKSATPKESYRHSAPSISEK